MSNTNIKSTWILKLFIDGLDDRDPGTDLSPQLSNEAERDACIQRAKDYCDSITADWSAADLASRGYEENHFFNQAVTHTTINGLKTTVVDGNEEEYSLTWFIEVPFNKPFLVTCATRPLRPVIKSIGSNLPEGIHQIVDEDGCIEEYVVRMNQ